MTQIKFAGLTGNIVKSSPHGNYLVVELTNRISIIGTFSNQFNWEQNPDASSGFESFITYIGVQDELEATKYLHLACTQGGYFYSEDEKMRKSKRCLSFPFELKIRGLSPESVVTLINSK